jgi:aminoglycoside phosphotransferase (APT) family kinase protein
LGEGCDNVAFDVAGEWVFRFPKREEVANQLITESKVLARISDRSPIPIPRPSRLGEPSAAFPFRFSGYPRLPGVEAIRLAFERIPFDQVAPVFGRFLSWLHSTPIVSLDGFDLEWRDIDIVLMELRQEALGDFERVRGSLEETRWDRWLAFLEAGPPGSAQDPRTPVLVHSDLVGEHILIDRVALGVTGIIDWADVQVSDPSFDFGGLLYWGGERFLHAVADAYDGPFDSLTFERARYIAACRCISDLTYAIDMQKPEYMSAALRALPWAIG